MDKKVREKVKEFFKIASELKELGAIRSSKYTGDIAEFICSKLYKIKLNQSSREEGYDGTDKYGKKVEIKFHGGSKGTNIDMSKYRKNGISFDYLLILLDLDSNIRPDDVPSDAYAIYKIENYVGDNIAKTYLKSIGYNKLLDINFKEI
jgi:hypothetical protein